MTYLNRLNIRFDAGVAIAAAYGPGTGGITCPNINYDAIDSEDDETTVAA